MRLLEEELAEIHRILMDIVAYLRTLMLDGGLSEEVFNSVSKLDYPSERQLATLLPPGVLSRVRFLFFSSKYTKPLVAEYRHLNDADIAALREKLEAFFDAFGLPHSLLEDVLSSKFTILRAGEQKVSTPLPPQEVPVEE